MTMTRIPVQTLESDAVATTLLERFTGQAHALVRHIKDQAYEDAVLLLVSRMLTVHTEAQSTLLAEVKARIAHIDGLMELMELPPGADADGVTLDEDPLQ